MNQHLESRYWFAGIEFCDGKNILTGLQNMSNKTPIERIKDTLNMPKSEGFAKK